MNICNNTTVLCTRRFPLDSKNPSKGYACSLPENDMFGCIHSQRFNTDTEIDNINEFRRLLIFTESSHHDVFFTLACFRGGEFIDFFTVQNTEDFNRVEHAIRGICEKPTSNVVLLPHAKYKHVALWRLHDKISALLKADDCVQDIKYDMFHALTEKDMTDLDLKVISITNSGSDFSGMSKYEFCEIMKKMKTNIQSVVDGYSSEPQGVFIFKTDRGCQFVVTMFHESGLIDDIRASLPRSHEIDNTALIYKKLQ